MSTQRKRYSAEFKARVALDAVKVLKTVNELVRLSQNSRLSMFNGAKQLRCFQ